MVTRRPSSTSQRAAAQPNMPGSEAQTHLSGQVLTLLIAAEDRAHDLLYIQQSLNALTKLVAAGYEKPGALLDADRGELSALLTVLSDHAAWRISNAIAAVEAAGVAARR